MCEFLTTQKESLEISCPHTENRSYGKAPDYKALQWSARRQCGQETPGTASSIWILTAEEAQALSLRG